MASAKAEHFPIEQLVLVARSAMQRQRDERFAKACKEAATIFGFSNHFNAIQAELNANLAHGKPTAKPPPAPSILVGGPSYVTHLFTFTPMAANAEYYVEIVREKYALRVGALGGNDYRLLPWQPLVRPEEMADAFEATARQVRAVATNPNAQGCWEVDVTASRVLEGMQLACGRKGQTMGLPSGFRQFDQHTSGLQNSDMVVVAARPSMHKLSGGLALVMIDYLQLATSPSRRGQEKRQVEVAEISAGIKALAKELQIPVLVLAQLNRKADDRSSVPRLSDLRESGAIEQDADLVAVLHRPEYYAQNEEEKRALVGQAELHLLKHSNGAVGEVPLTFLKHLTRFENRAQGPF